MFAAAMANPKMLSAAGGSSGIGGFMSKFSSITIKFKEFLIALAIVLAFCLLVWIVIYCFRVMYVRVLWIRRAEDLEAFMKSITTDMQKTVMIYDALIDTKPVTDTDTDTTTDTSTLWTSEIKRLFGDTSTTSSGTVSGIISLIRAKTPKETDINSETKQPVMQTDLEWYYKYKSIFANNVDLLLYDVVFKEFKRPEFQPPSDRVMAKSDPNTMGREYCLERIRSIDNLIPLIQKAIANMVPIEKAISESEDFPKKQQFIQFFMGIRHIDMYLNVYGDTLMKMYENRRVSFFNYLISLVRPQYERFIVQEVIERWQQALSSQNYDNAKTEFRTRWWALREWIFSFITQITSGSNDVFDKKTEIPPLPTSTAVDGG